MHSNSTELIAENSSNWEIITNSLQEHRTLINERNRANYALRKANDTNKQLVTRSENKKQIGRKLREITENDEIEYKKALGNKIQFSKQFNKYIQNETDKFNNNCIEYLDV